jgi:hypothetical protein
MNLEEEIGAMMTARIEQSDEWNQANRSPVTKDDVVAVVAVTMKTHREAILRLAREIDNLAGR